MGHFIKRVIRGKVGHAEVFAAGENYVTGGIVDTDNDSVGGAGADKFTSSLEVAGGDRFKFSEGSMVVVCFNLSLAEVIVKLVGWRARSVRNEEDIVSP